MRDTYKKKKINLFEFLILVLLIMFGSYFTIKVNSEYSDKQEKITTGKKEVASNDEKIEAKEIYKRLQTYGYRLSTVDNLIKYEDSIVNWYEFLLEFKEKVPKDVTFNTLDSSAETKKVSMQFISPTEERLLETLKIIEETEGFIGVEFNTISQEKVSFLGDKRQYRGFSTTITAYIDEEYLNDRYVLIRNYKKLKYDIGDSENVMDLTREFGTIDEQLMNSTGGIDIENELYGETEDDSYIEEDNGYIQGN